MSIRAILGKYGKNHLPRVLWEVPSLFEHTRMADIETGEVECPSCGYFWPSEKVKNICDACTRAEEEKREEVRVQEQRDGAKDAHAHGKGQAHEAHRQEGSTAEEG